MHKHTKQYDFYWKGKWEKLINLFYFKVITAHGYTHYFNTNWQYVTKICFAKKTYLYFYA